MTREEFDRLGRQIFGIADAKKKVFCPHCGFKTGIESAVKPLINHILYSCPSCERNFAILSTEDKKPKHRQLRTYEVTWRTILGKEIIVAVIAESKKDAGIRFKRDWKIFDPTIISIKEVSENMKDKSLYVVSFNYHGDEINFYVRAYSEAQAVLFACRQLEHKVGMEMGSLFPSMVTDKKYTVTKTEVL